jgi:hypothetical protein
MAFTVKEKTEVAKPVTSLDSLDFLEPSSKEIDNIVKDLSSLDYDEVGVSLSELNSGIDNDDLAAIQQMQAIQEAENTVINEAISKEKLSIGWIRQEKKIDQHNVRRYLVKLTPSMCKERGCGFDAAVAAQFIGGWNDVRLNKDQMLPHGKTIGQAILDILKKHQSTQHLVIDDHILSDEQVKRNKGWSGVSDHFLTGV